MLLDISVRVIELHRTGWAHRDLKPGNIMLLPKKLKWVLIDFGISARIGEQTPPKCTPMYAAPETAQACLDMADTIEASAAVDAWSLGVIAVELMFGYMPFGISDAADVRSFLSVTNVVGISMICFAGARLADLCCNCVVFAGSTFTENTDRASNVLECTCALTKGLASVL